MRAKEVRILVRDKRALKSTKMDHLPTANPLPTTNFQSTVRNSRSVVAFIPHVGHEQMGGALHHSQNEKEAFASSTPRKINSLGYHHRMAYASPPSLRYSKDSREARVTGRRDATVGNNINS